MITTMSDSYSTNGKRRRKTSLCYLLQLLVVVLRFNAVCGLPKQGFLRTLPFYNQLTQKQDEPQQKHSADLTQRHSDNLDNGNSVSHITSVTDDESVTSYSAVAVLDFTNNNDTGDNITSGVYCIPKHLNSTIAFHPGHVSTWQQQHDDEKFYPALLHALALTSDAVVILVDHDDQSRQLKHAYKFLCKGWEQRVQVGLSKSRLFIITPRNYNKWPKADQDAWKERVWLEDFFQISDTTIARLEICDSIESAIDSMKSETTINNGIDTLVSFQEYKKLVQAAFDSLSRNDDDDDEHHTLPIWSDHQEQPIHQTDRTTDTDNGRSNNDTDKIVSSEKVTDTDHNVELSIEMALRHVLYIFDQIQVMMEESWLDQAGEQEILPLDFASLLNPALLELRTALKQHLDENFVYNIWQEIRTNFVELYKQQLELLRDFHGRLYQYMISEITNVDDDAAATALAAQRVATLFPQAARKAVPSALVRTEELLHDLNLVFAQKYEGLLADMQHSTKEHEDELEALALEQIDDNEDNDDFKSNLNLPLWMTKLGARVMVLGINYLQGWLAWKSIQRVAYEREEQMPKFPLI